MRAVFVSLDYVEPDSKDEDGQTLAAMDGQEAVITLLHILLALVLKNMMD